jgi:signal transduction histidine kinase
VIVQESRRLSQMVDNVLLFSRSDRQALTIRREPVDVVALVADVVGAFRPQASSKQMTIDVEAGGVPRSVLADPNVIRQVLLNLLDNAAKYGVRGQRIAVRLTGTPESVSLSVEDEGPGIAEADRSRIWEPFWRAPGSAEGGTGLGLAIVRDLVTLHGGTAAVQSADVHGARFVATFRTPQADVAAATPDGRPVDQPV